MFEEFDCGFIANGLDLHHKKLNWFLGVKSFLYSGLQLQNFRLKSFLKIGFLNADPYYSVPKIAM